jgi:endoglucanase
MKSLKLVLVSALVASAQAWAGCLDAPRLVGVNTSGAEFNSSVLPGVINKNYIYPTPDELTFIKDQGATIIRLPIRWERIQRSLKSPLDPSELILIQQTVQSASNRGLCVLIDIHNYATYYADPLTKDPALQDGFVDLWLRLAREFNDPATTVFGLMNEPSKIPVADWASLAKRTLAELRRSNAKNMVFVAGGHWSGVHSWFTEQNGVSTATAFADLKDPLNRVVLEAHQYVNPYYSGTNAECLTPDQFDTMFQKINAWATTNNQRLFLGEFGTSATGNCLLTLDKLLQLTDNAVWRGWSYWAAGRWWPANYPFVLNTTNVGISPQWAVLKKYFMPAGIRKSPPNPPNLKR